MLDTVSVSLVQFKIYQEIEDGKCKIDPALYTAVHKIMISFVDVCALALTLKDGSWFHRTKATTKMVVLNNDSGISKALDEFKDLVERHSKIQGTVTLKYVMDNRTDLQKLLFIANDMNAKVENTEKGVNTLVGAEDSRKLEEIRKANLETLRTMLSISIEVTQAFKSTRDHYWDTCVEGSGKWILEETKYRDWLTASVPSSPMLLLTGDNRSGKSVLMSRISYQLQSQAVELVEKASTGTTTARKSIVAYHFFPSKSDKSSKDKEQRPTMTALKCLALQVAEQDSGYLKTAAAFCKSKSESYFKDMASATQLWQDLKLGAPERELKYFFLLDGLDQVSDDTAEELCQVLKFLQESFKSSGLSPVKVFLSCHADVLRRDTPDTIREVFRDVPEIDIGAYNEGDIRLYIASELKRRELLQGSDEKSRNLRESMLERLPTLGDFYKVEAVLSRIGDGVEQGFTFEELTVTLEEGFRDPKTIAENEVKLLRTKLNSREIDELNELLLWTMAAVVPLNLEQLEAALASYIVSLFLQRVTIHIYVLPFCSTPQCSNLPQ
jgi:hypothetical protein